MPYLRQNWKTEKLQSYVLHCIEVGFSDGSNGMLCLANRQYKKVTSADLVSIYVFTDKH